MEIIAYEDTKGTLQIVKGYGKTLGELHALMKEYPYSEERRNHKMLLGEIEERMQKYGASEIVRKEFEDVCKELESLPLSTSDYGVIHYDFEPDNVFYDDKEESFSVIDFDDALCCWYALDVVRALDALDEVIDTIFQVLGLNVVIYIGLYFMEFIEYHYAILETGLKLIYIIALVLISGFLFGWYNNLSGAVLVLMTIAIFVVCVFLDAISLLGEVKSINVLIEGEDNRNR